ncbi:hypothetical protein GCM10007978_05370 [Shewanella hanedai]|uniref:Uncharacterized protein n=1 Tax=Shewanella hanedai TaxID=25 RepID=A0A553JTN1_SHEHA|nr:hypothetical protein [Shewanella hanedai]TRY15815.1 hypothetical protein FN961_02190 [Shewanella hanedai]GGI70354.1 hypothetical protein GCM10007978_05370 [Shewanella hanedai]
MSEVCYGYEKSNREEQSSFKLKNYIMKIKFGSSILALPAVFALTSPVQAEEVHNVELGLKMVSNWGTVAPKSKVHILNDVWVALGRPSTVDFYVQDAPGILYHYSAAVVVSSNGQYRLSEKMGGDRTPPIGFNLHKVCIDYPAAYGENKEVCSSGASIYDGSSSGDYNWETHTVKLNKCRGLQEFDWSGSYNTGAVVKYSGSAFKAVTAADNQHLYNKDYWEELGFCD